MITAARDTNNDNSNDNTAPRSAVTILERRSDMYVLLVAGGKVVTVPATPYNTLKYEHFLGNRIMYSFGDGIGSVQETYNDGIFNCTYRDMSMQIRSRDVIAVAILEHMRCMRPSLYESLFREEYERLHQADLLRYMLAGYRDRVRVVAMAGSGSSGSRSKEEDVVAADVDVYIDDGLFKIDAHGNAGVISFEEEDGKKEMYRPICIVAHGDIKERSIETPIGPVSMNEQTVTTLAKAMFLLDPDLEDNVFTRQLPPFVLEELKARRQRQKQDAQTTAAPMMMLMSVRKLVKAINDAMRRNDTALVHNLVTQNTENARKALEYLPPRHRFFVKKMLAQVTGPGATI
jgi:hypothetical protein